MELVWEILAGSALIILTAIACVYYYGEGYNRGYDLGYWEGQHGGGMYVLPYDDRTTAEGESYDDYGTRTGIDLDKRDER